ncbi:hypothetical protein [Aestuariivirga sp.]|uniref:hypothetical protein n=1 Tax=Aestuariivirga sp. TaxID=2650926 RepID=UPI003BA859CB
MKPGIPWSVKGVEPEAREAAKLAARRSGMTLGEWLNSVIFDQSEHSLGSSPLADSNAWENFVSSPPPPPDSPRPEPSRPSSSRGASSERRDDNALRLQDIAQQLASLAHRERQSAPIPALDRSQAAEREEFERIVERIDENERQTVEALTAVNERLNRLGQQLAQMSRSQTSFERPEDVPGYSVLESAIRNVVEHIEVSEKRTRDSLKSMQERLGEIAGRGNQMPTGEDIIRAAPILSNLESRLSDMLNRIQRSEGLVTERIEGVKVSAQQMANQAQSSAVTAARGELREMETRMLATLREAQAVATGPGSVTSEIARLHGDVAGLAKRMEDVKAATASERDLQSLRVALEQLSTRVAQGPDMRPLADMDKRLGDITWRLEQASASQSAPQVSALEQRIAELDHRLAEAMLLQGNPHATARLEESIAAVGARVAQTEEQLHHLETIEQAIRQLYDSLDQARNTAGEAAEEAARRALERYKPQAAFAGPSPELKALEEGLRAIRDSASGAERRHQETFDAVHETLAHIIEKISQIERAPQPAPPPVAAPSLSERVFAQPQPQHQYKAEARPQIFEVEAETPPPPAPPPPLSSGDDFIAAARRAAQAASTKPSALRSELAASSAIVAEKKGFSLPLLDRFRKKAEAPSATAAAAPAEAPATPTKTGRFGNARRTALITAGLALLVAASIFAYRNLAGPEAEQPKQSSRIEAPADAKPLGVKLATTQPAVVLEPSDPIVTSSLPQGSLAKVLSEPALPRLASPAPETGTAALRTAAVNGDARAQFIIAGRYLEGQGVGQDYEAAFYWYQQSASRGLAPAQYRIATLYELGKGVPKDAARALLWYERAAQNGNVRAMHNAAVIAAGDQAGPTDYAKAFRWFEAAASRGFADSQFNLAILYERGLGTEASNAQAYFWYSQAARQGDPDSGKRAAVLARSLADPDLKAVDARLASWAPVPSDDTSNVVTVVEPAWKESRLKAPARSTFS